MIPPLAGIAVVLAALGALMGGLALFERRFSPQPEVPRKILHVAMGVITLTFPWLFASAWPVAVLAVLAEAALLGVRLVRGLRAGLGSVLHGVSRESFGELYFPAAVATVFWLAHGDVVTYVVPVLMLTLADALAAVVGIRYGRPRFATTEEPKSIEGSVAFFAVAFLSAHVPLLLLTNVGRAETLMISAILGLLLAALEAVSWHGIDNLLVPIGGYVFLQVHLGMSTADLAVRLAALVALAVFALVWRTRTTLSHRGVMTAVLACYAYWSLGGLPWLIAPVALFFTYTVLPTLTAEERSQHHDARIVASNVAVGLAWVFIAAVRHAPGLLFPFSVAFAAEAAMNGFNRLVRRYRAWSPASVATAAAAKGAILLVLAVLLVPAPQRSLPLAAAGAVAVVAAVLADAVLERVMGEAPNDVRRGWAQAAVALAVSLGAALAGGVL